MLAIIIPYYKRTFFEETLQSLVNQTNKQFKVYIGDDASPEDCSELLKLFKGKFDFVYHRFENNLGGVSLTKQWERCIALSGDEEWIMILGDDDVLGIDVVEAFYENINELIFKGIRVIRYATQKVDEDFNFFQGIWKHPQEESVEEFIVRKYKSHVRSTLSEYVFKRQSLMEKGIKDFPLAWCSDLAMVMECANFGTIYTINNSLVFIRYSSINISSLKDNLTLKKKQLAIRLYCSFLLNKLKYIKDKREIVLIVSNFYKNDRKNIKLFIRLNYIYLSHLFLKEYFLFVKKVLKIKEVSDR